jgi:hypothetical protein
MLDDSILIENLIENMERAATIHHVVLRDDLEPVDDRFLLEYVLVMRDSQTNSHTVLGEPIEPICCHSHFQSPLHHQQHGFL